MTILMTLFSLITLVWAANHLVTGAAGVANYYRISPLTIGLTIIAIGTSAPEIFMSLSAALDGRTPLALGNAIGSNIANIGLVLGITILIRPFTMPSSTLHREYPLLFLIMLFSYSLMIDGYLNIMDGILFLLATIALIGYFLIIESRTAHKTYIKEYKKMINIHRPMRANWFSLVLGLLMLPVSTHFLLNGATQFATWLGANELTIGLTIVALGTSLPELVTSLIATYKGQDDIAIGNILGSNMYNLLIVLAFPSIINPSPISHVLLWRDIPIMLIIACILFWINYHYKKRIVRWHGGLLLLIYCCYVISLLVNFW